jgi:hypothetical protein
LPANKVSFGTTIIILIWLLLVLVLLLLRFHDGLRNQKKNKGKRTKKLEEKE